MKILVFAHQLEIGGTQVNAVDLAASLRDVHGHDVVVFATPGPMVALLHERRLRYIAAPVRAHPSPARMAALRAAARRERPDLLHVWDWWQCLDAYYAVHLPTRIPMVVTDMMADPTRLLPVHLPRPGTPAVDRALAAGRGPVDLPPPVDVQVNGPGVVDAAAFRRAWGIAPHEIAIVLVSRLAPSLKGESLFRSVDAVRTLAHDLPLRLVIVGDGAARAPLQSAAAAVNATFRRPVVTLTGPLLDPRPAYAAADVVLGMGGSALRAMAFAKPVVIVGEGAFASPLTPTTAPAFLYRGMNGTGDPERDQDALARAIRRLAELPPRA